MGDLVSIKQNEIVADRDLKALKDGMFRGFSDAEIGGCLAICEQLQLNPLVRQIHFIKRLTKDGPVITPQTGIDGYRLIANRTGCYAGSDEPVYEYAADQKRPTKATVTVYKMMQGQRCAFTASARWDEYANAKNDMWNRMPHNQLAKCAEALALRKAFPAELSALRSDEEMQQADTTNNKAEDVQKRIEAAVTDIETTSTPVNEDAEPMDEPSEPIGHLCGLCGKEMKLSKAGTTWYCPDFQNKEKGEHPRIKA